MFSNQAKSAGRQERPFYCDLWSLLQWGVTQQLVTYVVHDDCDVTVCKLPFSEQPQISYMCQRYISFDCQSDPIIQHIISGRTHNILEIILYLVISTQ